jgi:hypothetical protein
MFILRRVLNGKLEINTCLGIEYVLVLRKQNKEEFEERTKLWCEDDLKGVYGLICFDESELIMPLYEDSSYYIMTSNGKTFANVSLS